MTKNEQIVRPINGLTYEFKSRWDNERDAMMIAFCENWSEGMKHAYCQKVTVKGVTFWDVRICKH